MAGELRCAGVSRGAGEMVESALAYAARGQIDDAGEAHVVIRVGDEAQVGDDVLDFLTLVELHAANDLIRHAVAKACFLQRARLRVHAVHHRNVAEAWS